MGYVRARAARQDGAALAFSWRCHVGVWGGTHWLKPPEKKGKAKLSGGTCPLLLKVTCRLWVIEIWKREEVGVVSFFLSFFLADVAHSRAIPRALFGWSWLLKRGPTIEVTCVSICRFSFAKLRFGEGWITGPNGYRLSTFFGGAF